MKLTPLQKTLQETGARLSEAIHALQHMVECGKGTDNCKDCRRLAKAAIAGKHWTEFVDDDKQ